MVDRESLPLEPSPDEMRAMASAATASLVENISTLLEQPASRFDEIERLVQAPGESPPEAGAPFHDLLRQAVEGAAHGFTTTGPGFLAYTPGGGLWSAVVADFIAAGLNRFVTIWDAAPALVQIEWQALRWLAELFGYPDTSSGIFTSGGSMSNFSAIVTARRARLGEDLTGGTPNFSDLSPELSRDFRGLRVWLPLKLHGVEAFRAALDEKLDLTRVLFEGIRDLPGVVIPWEPELSIVAFQLEREGTTPEEADRATHRLLDRINASRRVFLSSTRLAGRPCILSHRTHRDRIDEAIEIIRRAVGELAPS